MDVKNKIGPNNIPILNSFDDFIFVLDSEGKIIFANKYATQRLGYDDHELELRSVLEVHPPERREEAGRIVINMLLGLEKICPIPLITKSGQLIPVETKVSSISLDGESLILGISRDISEWIENNRMLSESEIKFKKTFELSARLMAISDFYTGTYHEINETFAQITGYTREEIIGKTSIELKLFSPEKRKELIHQLIENKSIKNAEIELYGKNKSEPVLISFDGVKFEADGKLYLISTAEDITERKRNEKSLAESRQQLQKMLEATRISEEKLRFREGFEQLINDVATRLINIPLEEIDKMIEIFLKKIGEFIRVDRAYLFLYGESNITVSNTHEWCREGISPQMKNLQNVPVTVIPWWNEQILANRSIILYDIETLPDEAESEKKMLKTQEIKSLIVVPLSSYEKVTGFLGFDSVREYRSWIPETELLLQNSGITLVNAIQRKAHETEIRNYRDHLETIISERTRDLKSSHQQLRKSFDKLASQHDELVKFKNIADKANYAILILSTEGKVLYANRKITDMIGVNENKLFNRPFINDFIDNECPGFQSLENSLTLKKDLSPIEVNIKTANEKLIPAFANISAINNKRNRFLFFVVSFIDLTERKLEEQEMKVLWQAIEHSGNGIMITDQDMNIIYVNKQYESTCGYEFEELKKMAAGLFRPYYHPPEFYISIKETIDKKKIWKGHLLNIRKNGTEYTDDTVISSVMNSRGHTTHYVAITRDVTDNLRHDKEIRQSEKLRALGTLAGGVAHDFNNILQIVQVYSELIEAQDKNKVVNRDNIKEIQNACERGKSVVSNILTFSREESSEMAPYNFSFLVSEIIKVARPLYPSSIEIVSKTEPTGDVICDPVQIQQIFFNLFNNSVDAMKGKGIIRVVLEKIKPDNNSMFHDISLIISDTGQGMSKETIDRAFEPFYTTKGVGEGTGLGLSTVMGIVIKHNALISIQSEIGKGTGIQILFNSCKKN